MENVNERINDNSRREQLLTFRSQLESARQEFDSRIWETLKLFFTVWPIVSVVLSVIA